MVTTTQYHFLKVEPALPSILSQPLIFQRKFDGVSSEVFIGENNEYRIVGRGILKGRNSEYTLKFPEFASDLKNIPKGTDFLPEIIIVNKKTGTEDLGLVQGRTTRESNIDLYASQYPALMIIHDVVRVGDTDVSQLPYFDRLDKLRTVIGNQTRNRIFFIANMTDGVSEWKKVMEHSLEGLVIRDPKFQLGKGVCKLKRELTEDVFCKGEFTPSDASLKDVEYELNGEKRKGVFANLICYQLNEGKEVPVCDVGGGFTIDERIEIQKRLDSGLVTKEKPLILEVKANARFENCKLRHPAFLRVRTDKRWQECEVNER